MCPIAPRLTARKVIRPGLARIRCGAIEKSSSVTVTRPSRARAGAPASSAQPAARQGGGRGEREGEDVARSGHGAGGLFRMLCAAHAPPPTELAALPLVRSPRSPLTGCGTASIELAKNDPDYEGAELFVEHCSGCHTLDAAGTEGSATKVKTRENKDGPNFDQRKENEEDVLYAIENGGFSSGPMPQNIVTGEDAQKVAAFVAKYSGRRAEAASAAAEPTVLDLKAIRRDPEPVRAALARRRDGSDAAARRRARRSTRAGCELLPEVEALRARQNEASQGIARAKKAGEDASEAIAEMQEVSRRVEGARRGAERRRGRARAGARLAAQPARPDAPPTRTRRCARSATRRRTGADHLELAGGLIDMEAGARVAGSRFAYLKGDLVLLELALVRWALELLGERGFEPVVPPVLVREEALFGTGFLPDTEQQIYRLADDALYLAGTSEVALASLHAGEMLDEADAAAALRGLLAVLPPRGRRRRAATRAASSACTSSTRSRCSASCARRTPRPSTSGCSTIEEEILQALEIPYRVVNIAVDDLGSSAAKKYDCEAWLPGQQRYRELTSTSNTTDFQARRLDIRYRPDGGGKPRARPHAQRHRGRGRPHADRAAREPPARRRHGRRARGPARVGCATDPAGRRPRNEPRRRSPRTTPRSPTSRRPPTTARPRSTTSRSARRPSSPEEDAPLPGLPEREPPAAD